MGLTYRGNNIQVKDGIFLEVVAGLYEARATRGGDLLIPSATGRVFKTKVFDSITIGLVGHITGGLSGTSAERANRFLDAAKLLYTWMDPTLGPGALVYTINSRIYTIQAAPVTGGTIFGPQMGPEFRKVACELVAYSEWVQT